MYSSCYKAITTPECAEDSSISTSNDLETAPITTSNDLARIMHMLADSSLQSKWQDSFAVMDRCELDDKDNRDYRRQILADVFNDYES